MIKDNKFELPKIRKLFYYFFPFKGKEVRLKFKPAWYGGGYMELKYSVNGGKWYNILEVVEDLSMSGGWYWFRHAKTWSTEYGALKLSDMYERYGTQGQLLKMIDDVYDEQKKKNKVIDDAKRKHNKNINDTLNS